MYNKIINHHRMFLLIICAILLDCTKPVYLYKGFERSPAKPRILISPSACYGKFQYWESNAGDKGKDIYETQVDFCDWEEFDQRVNYIVRSEFGNIASEATIIDNEQAFASIKKLIANDSVDDKFLQYHVLTDLDTSCLSVLNEQQTADLIVFITDLTLLRTFPNIYVTFKFRVYETDNGLLVLANAYKKRFNVQYMVGTMVEIMDDISGGKTPQRMYGIHQDEKKAYEDTCRQIIGLAIKDIKAHLIGK